MPLPRKRKIFYKHDGWIGNYGLGATYHRLTSDRMVRRYGDEIDVIASARIKGYTVAARLAHYVSRSYSTNTDKVLVTVDWRL